MDGGRLEFATARVIWVCGKRMKGSTGFLPMLPLAGVVWVGACLVTCALLAIERRLSCFKLKGIGLLRFRF